MVTPDHNIAPSKKYKLPDDTMFFRLISHALVSKIPPKKPKGKLVVIGCGKASAAMAKSFEENYDGDYSGIVVTNYGNNIQTNTSTFLHNH